MRFLDKKTLWKEVKLAAKAAVIVIAFTAVALLGGAIGGLMVSGHFDGDGPELTGFQRNWNATVAIVMPNGTKVGTGVIVSRQGHVLTAAHVVDNIREGETLRVEIDGTVLEKTYDAEIIATDELRDLALLRIPVNYPSPAFIETGDVPPYPGDRVYSIGFPGELQSEKMTNVLEVRLLSWVPRLGPGVLPQSIDTMMMNNRLEPGYSGAGIFLDRNGRLTGMYNIEIWTLSNMPAFRESPVAVPVRRIRPFLDANGVPYNDPGPSWWQRQWRRLESEASRLMS